MVYNEIEFIIESSTGGLDELYDEATRYLYLTKNVEIKMVHSIARSPFCKEKHQTLTFKNNSPSELEALRKTFEDVLNGRFYDLETNAGIHINYDGHWKNLPWVLAIDHLPEGMQELIRSIFKTDHDFGKIMANNKMLN